MQAPAETLLPLSLLLYNILFRWRYIPVAQPPWPQPLSAVSRAVIVDRDVKFMGISTRRQPASEPSPYGVCFQKTKKSARAAIFIRSFTGERGGRPSTSSTDPRSPGFNPSPPFQVLAIVPSLVLERLNRSVWAKSNNAISGRLRRELSELLFALLPPTTARAPAVTIIYEGRVPGIRYGVPPHVRGEVTCAEVTWPTRKRLEEGESGGRCKGVTTLVDTRSSYDVVGDHAARSLSISKPPSLWDDGPRAAFPVLHIRRTEGKTDLESSLYLRIMRPILSRRTGVHSPAYNFR